jgi:hypothetical protein
MTHDGLCGPLVRLLLRLESAPEATEIVSAQQGFRMAPEATETVSAQPGFRISNLYTPTSPSGAERASDRAVAAAGSATVCAERPRPTGRQVQDLIRAYARDRAKEGRTPNQDEAVQIVQAKYRITRKPIRKHYRKVTGRDITHRGYHKL